MVVGMSVAVDVPIVVVEIDTNLVVKLGSGVEIIRFVVNVGKLNGDFVDGVYVGFCVEMNFVVISGE